MGGFIDKIFGRTKMLKLLADECKAGDGESCNELELMYYNGKGVKQNYFKAAEYAKKACDLNYGDGCNDLGVMYGKGKGVRQDNSLALEYYGKACDFESQLGCDNYAYLKQEGE